MMQQRNLGFTLIELMITLVLSLILTLAFIQTMLIVKNIYCKQEALARIQENARSIHYVLGQAVIQSGIMGCNRMSDEIGLKINQGVNAERLGILPFQGIKTGNYSIPKVLKTPAPESDVLWVKYTKKYYPLAQGRSGEEGYFVIHGKPNWKKNRIVILSDCRHADIISVVEQSKRLSATMSRVYYHYNPREPKNYQYPISAQMARLHSVLFYVAKTNRTNQYNEPIYALYSTDFNGKTQERVEGVEKLKFEYGVIRNNTLVFYPTTELTSNEDVKVIRAHVLLNSIEPVKAEQGNTLLRQWWTWEWSTQSAK